MKAIFKKCGQAQGVAPVTTCRGQGFTLIELLVVISIIGILAAFILSVGGSVARKKYISTAQSELASIETALEAYKAQYGFYPPSNPNFNLPVSNPNFALTSPLFFELEGVTNSVSGATTNYQTLDGRYGFIAANASVHFGVAGLINCTRGSGEDMVSAKNFLPDLKTTQIGISTNPAGNAEGVAILLTSVGGPDQAYKPLTAANLNPWRYNSINPSNNPASYDLYVQLQINNKKYLVCNWTKQNPINTPLP